MEKELLDAFADYVASTNTVLESLAEAHYINGTNNRQFAALRKSSEKLLATLKTATAWKSATPSPTPAPATTGVTA